MKKLLAVFVIALVTVSCSSPTSNKTYLYQVIDSSKDIVFIKQTSSHQYYVASTDGIHLSKNNIIEGDINVFVNNTSKSDLFWVSSTKTSKEIPITVLFAGKYYKTKKEYYNIAN